ncbi:hypothetical protein ACTI_07440 [Actinoplanes sp. OR16]|uniref:peptidase inhibitor family I36 protein n=1 Tax=Actinoplanes sp. OR16 TaxID=946334 RepID=UPI000F6FDDCF|nr:peptidase inhibitor family I36 protein [Actinoplanes sp. OR16]BBH64059.1 hypothetical protein ACTI_07440 [Actinoplanes sp. OR16]
MRKNSFRIVFATVVAGFLIAPANAALAGVPAPSAPPAAVTATAGKASSGKGLATFKGATIDLAKGWGGARSCTVKGPGDVECFATIAEADAKSGYKRETDALVVRAKARGLATAALPTCADRYLCLYEHINGGGRRLQFANEYWQNLDDYGFANTMSSWRNNSYADDPGSVRDKGGKGQLDISPRTYSSNIGTFWNDTADEVYG